ncbi:MAG: insulinase family protein, partial [Planctomycetes bacterium]|nr:insulinase family protein [Planctomycetota bacterium]
VKRVEDLAEVRDRILSTCKALATTPVSAERIAAVKSNLRYGFAASLDSSSGIAEALAGALARTRTPATVNAVYTKYDKVGPADLRRAAARYLVDKGRTIATLCAGDKPKLPAITVHDVPVEANAVAGGAVAPPLPHRLELDAAAAAPAHAVLLPSRSPLVAMRIVFQSGAAADPAGKAGLAHVTAQMLTAAATRKRSYDDVVAALFPMAASLSASVDKQMTVFAGTVHRDNLPRYYALVREMLTEPAFLQADLDRIKSNTIAQIDAGLRQSDDEETGKEVLYQELYAGHPFGRLNLGSIEQVRGITLDDVKAFYQERLKAPVVGLSGGYPDGFPARVATDLKAVFGAPRDLADHPVDYTAGVKQPRHDRLTVVEKETLATGIHAGFPIDITRGHPDWVALWLVRSYFGEHRSENSYLYQRLREIRGLNYGDYAYIEHFPHGGASMRPEPNVARASQIFQIWIRPVPPQNGPFAFKAMQYELHKLLEKGVTPADFAATRAFLGRFVKTLVASQDRQLGYALDSRFYKIGTFTEYVQKALEKLTVDEVNRVLRKYLRADRVQYVVVTKDAQGFVQRLLGSDPTPIEYTSKPAADVLEEDKRIEVWKAGIDRKAVRVLPIAEVFR